MADEIDIEEHDVFDNPVIRSIFPDISVIKKEISQYYEDVPDIKQEPGINAKYEKSSTDQFRSSITTKCENNSNQGTPRTTNCLPDIVDNSNFNNTPNNKPRGTLKTNKIILGSKPNNTKPLQHSKDVENKMGTAARVPKVLLQDLAAYIFRNNRYCKDCLTLFPSRPDFDDHRRSVHSIITRNKKVNVKVTLEKNGNKCNICSACFSCSSNLNRHYKNVHKKKVPSKQNKNKCNICGSNFSCSSNLSRHYKNVHKRKVTFKSKYKTNKKLMIATNTSRVASINQITRSRRNLVSRNVNSDANNLCFHCKESFPDKKSLIEHIYKVLEPKRYPKRKVGKYVTPNKTEYVTANDTLNKKHSNSNIGDDHGSSASKTGKEKLHFKNQDTVTDRSQSLRVKENNENRNIKTSIQKKKVNVSKDLLKSEQTSTETKTDNQDLDPCSSKSLNNKRKYDNLNACVKVTQSLTKRRNENKLILGPKSSKIKRQHDNQDLDACGSKSIKDKIKKKMDLDLSEINTVKYKQLENEMISIGSKIDDIGEELQFNEDDEDNLESTFVYECIYCTYVLPTARAYFIHIVGKHKVEKISRVNKVIYDEQCKYCPSKSNQPASRNKHLYSYHHDLVYKQFPNEASGFEDRQHKSMRFKNPAFKMFESFVLESIIYKCNKCDIHFLSSYIAKDHEKHMELLINWKCSICRRIFKKHDKHLHLKQHQFSKTLNVCQFNESELSRLLYNCTKCAVHFTEERYLEHFSKCDVETTDSVYCKICDILVDKCGYKSHETKHGTGNNISDFTVIAADIIPDTKSEEIKVVKKRTRLYEQVNCLTFCQTCKSYLTDIGLTRKTHIESRCSKIIKHVCNLCGLVLTNCALRTHRQHHKKKNNLKLQDYKFFDLQGIQILPPIPEYPCCNICEVNFVSKNAVISHICSETEYLTCDLCNIKLSENAFKLHMNFHSYSMPNANKDKSQGQQSMKQKTELDRDTVINPNANTLLESRHNEVDPTDEKSRINSIVYSCQSCKISVDAYDKVIEHCQNHYSPIPKNYSTVKICSKCTLKFESDTYEDHKQFHSRPDTGLFLMFDPAYFMSDNEIWIQHMFASVPQSVQKEIVGQSIYQHECRIKMEVFQKGPSYLTVYKCDRCGNFIDSGCIFAHVKDACSKNIRKHPCTICGLPFMSSVFRSKHEKIHRRYESIRIKSYNIVLINCEKHNSYNTSILTALEQYVLYQCRTCDGIVEKLQRNAHECNIDNLQECSICKLLLYKDDYDAHISKHNDLVKFNTANIKVVLFGNKDESYQKKTLSLSFCGRISDHTLYKCTQCEVCVNNKSLIAEHICTVDNSKWKCPKCGFYICTRHALDRHIHLHDTDPEFNTENIQVIKFNLPRDSVNKSLDQTSEETHTFQGKSDMTKEREQKSIAGCEPAADPDVTNSNNILSSNNKYEVEEQESVALYKCACCGLHYIEKLNAKNHANNCNPKGKTIRQNCSKCSLLFNPKELFSHLIAHHGDKNKTFRYEIIEISAEKDDS